MGLHPEYIYYKTDLMWLIS